MSGEAATSSANACSMQADTSAAWAAERAAQAAIVHLPGGPTAQGQLALRIDFAAPGPLGLLTGGASA